MADGPSKIGTVRRRELHDRPNWSPITHVIEGELEAAAFDFKEIPLGPSSPLHNCGFYEVVARGVEFDLYAVHLGVA